MIEKKINNTEFFAFENLSIFKNLINFVSTRKSGDMALKEANPDEYIKTRKKFLATFGIELSRTIFCEQVHGNQVEVIDKSCLNHKTGKLNIVSGVDAMVTNTQNLCLVVKTADCVPILLYDPKLKVIGIAHAGWKGTLLIIGKLVAKTMKNKFKSSPKDIVVGLGPSIGPKYFFVRRDVQEQFEKAGWSDFLQYSSPDQWLVDLPGINKKQLIDSGIKAKNIEMSDISTYSSDKFFSYRKKDPEGHFITGIMLK